MSLEVSDAISRIQQELNQVGQQVDDSDIKMYLSDAVEYFSTTYAFPTAKRFFDTLFFARVRQIGVPEDFGTVIEPQRPPSLRSPRFMNQTSRELTHWPYGCKISVEYEGETPYLDVVYDELFAFDLSSCDDTTGVTISGDGSNLTLDNMIYTEGTGSLRFVVTPSTGQTVLTFTGLGPIDVTEFLTKNWNFLDLIAPSTNTVDFTSIVLRIGNDASNYYEMTATTRYRGDGIGEGYGQIGIDFTASTETGSVTDTNIIWMQVVLNHGTTGVGGVYHIDNIFSAQGAYFQIPYYSLYNILAGGTTRTNVIEETTDVIMLPRDCNGAVIYKTLELIASSPNVKDESFANYAARELTPKEALLRTLYPLERSLVQSQWYKKTNFRRSIRRY